MLAGAVLAGTGWVLTFPHSPEDWSQLTLLRTRGFLGALAPFAPDAAAGIDGYPYYRPIWFAYLKLCDLLGLGGGPSHAGVVAAHLAGVLLGHAALERCGVAPRVAWVTALLAGLAPGTATALSWLAAGNKAFTFLCLSAGFFVVAGSERGLRSAAALVLAGVLAIGCSENAYIVVGLLPACWILRHGAGSWRSTFTILGVLLVVALLHLVLLSPQAAAGAGDDQLATLRAAIAADPVGWARSVLGNLGRYLLHGLGVGDDLPVAGAAVLAGLFTTTLAPFAGRRRLGLALLLFVALNVPASLLPGMTSRHHAYLPAIGAGVVAAQALCAVPRAVWLAMPGAIGLMVQGWSAQSVWSGFLHHSERVLESARTLRPAVSAHPSVRLINFPTEYRAAFGRRFHPTTRGKTWDLLTFLKTGTDTLLPEGMPVPAGAYLLEYDGRQVRSVTAAELEAEPRAPLAWFLPSIVPFAQPELAWSEILSSGSRLAELNRAFRAADRAGERGPARRVEVLAHELLGHPITWQVEAELDAAAWLVLGWVPLPLPPTEAAWIFNLRPLPWPFEVVVRPLDDPTRTLDVPVHPVLGFLPALWLEPGRHRLRVELRVPGL